jgi:hypothetical protein
MKQSKAIPPYNKLGRANYPIRGKSGVYIIYENDKPVYVGYSQNDLYKTMYRHFQNWNHTGQEVVTYLSLMDTNKYTVRVIYCTPKQAISLEKQLIIKYQPRDCENKYQGYKPDRYDKEVILNYAKTGKSSNFRFTKKELSHFQQVIKEDKEFEEEQERQPRAMFGDELTNEGKFELCLRKDKHVGFIFLYTLQDTGMVKIKSHLLYLGRKTLEQISRETGVEIKIQE